LMHHVWVGAPYGLTAGIQGVGTEFVVRAYPPTLRPLENPEGDNSDRENSNLQFKVLNVAAGGDATIQVGLTSDVVTIDSRHPLLGGLEEFETLDLTQGNVTFVVKAIASPIEIRETFIDVINNGGDDTGAFRTMLFAETRTLVEKGTPRVLRPTLDGLVDNTLLIPDNTEMAKMILDPKATPGNLIPFHILGLAVPAKVLPGVSAGNFMGAGIPNGASPNATANEFAFTTVEQGTPGGPITLAGRLIIQEEFAITLQGNMQQLAGVIGYTPPEVVESSASQTVVGIMTMLVSGVAAVLFV
jgi:hypothetical protein